MRDTALPEANCASTGCAGSVGGGGAAGFGARGGGTALAGAGDGAMSGAAVLVGVKTKGSSQVGHGTVSPVPSAGYSMDWPQCGHSPFRNSAIAFFIAHSLKDQEGNAIPQLRLAGKMGPAGKRRK